MIPGLSMRCDAKKSIPISVPQSTASARCLKRPAAALRSASPSHFGLLSTHLPNLFSGSVGHVPQCLGADAANLPYAQHKAKMLQARCRDLLHQQVVSRRHCRMWPVKPLMPSHWQVTGCTRIPLLGYDWIPAHVSLGGLDSLVTHVCHYGLWP